MNNLSDSDRAEVLDDANAQFWAHIVTVVRIAFGIHVVLFALFLVLQVPFLLGVNGLSIVAYVACLQAIHQQRYRLAALLMSVEIIAHAVCATWVLGWDSNFHFYLYCVIPIIAFSFQTAWLPRLGLNLAIVLVAVGGFVLRQQMGRAPGVSSGILHVFGVGNLLAATGLLLYATALSVRFSLKMQLSLFQTAHHDSLTSLYTRRRILQRVRQLGSSAHVQAVAIILLDIDHFKLINDQHGHDGGDLILQRVADIMSASVRTSDMASRWGGEEFLVLMPDAQLVEAEAVAERIAQRIRAEAGQLEDAWPTVTATLAVTALRPGEAFRDALTRADGLLYAGKHAGRNRVVSSA
jgi:diguanylate cyclase (GGDEF)-like protein